MDGEGIGCKGVYWIYLTQDSRPNQWSVASTEHGNQP